MVTAFYCVFICMLTAAHFLRVDNFPMVVLTLSAPILLWIKKNVSLKIFQIHMIFCAYVWVTSSVAIIQERVLQNNPWLRAGVILGGIFCLVLWAIYLITRPAFVARYQRSPHTTAALCAFAITLIVSAGQARSLFVTTVVTLHALFMAIARI